MNCENIDTRSPYVEKFPTTPSLPATPSHYITSFWPTPKAEARLDLNTGHLRAGREVNHPVVTGLVSNIEARLATHIHHYSKSPQLALPPVEASRRLTSSPRPNEPNQTSELEKPAGLGLKLIEGLQTPPPSAILVRGGDSTQKENTTTQMADPRKMMNNQRPLMGPPETPSRLTQTSPNLFTNLQFSPDLFSHQNMDIASAPLYPQQRLFWDSSASNNMHHTPPQFQGQFTDEFGTSFNSNSTVVPQSFHTMEHSQPYDLPSMSRSMSTSFMDNSAFPAPFQTSPRAPPPPVENPTLFLSSPARRFGGPEQNRAAFIRRPAPEVPAYHHQIEESKREREEKRKSRIPKRPNEDELIMQSVRRALSPVKTARPGLQRSSTHTGVRLTRQRSNGSFTDSTSLVANSSNRVDRMGRVSPLGRLRTTALPAARTNNSTRSISLAIDENGVAKTVMSSLPEQEDEMDLDDNSDSGMTSDDETNAQMLYSFGIEEGDSLPKEQSFGDARNHLRATNKKVNKNRSRLDPTLDPRLDTQGSRKWSTTFEHGSTEILPSLNTDVASKGDAQQALRAILLNRSRSASTQDDPSSNSSLQFHSSPPMQPGQIGGYNASPTTITDPDLATPSTDVDSLSSMGATRCVCNSSFPDGALMVQCDSCSKYLHAACVGFYDQRLPEVYICNYCEQTPVRPSVNRNTLRSATHANRSPLAHKSQRHR